MKRVYEAPVMMVEKFELEQHIAKGCGVPTTVLVPGESVTGTITCYQTNGGGHWRFEDITIFDLDSNGKVDYAEIVAAAEANNISLTGQGHFTQHGVALEIPGEERVEIVPLNS